MPQQPKPLAMGLGPRLPMPHPRDLAAAFSTLTPAPWPRPNIHSARFARASLFFPLVGAAIGITLVGAQHLLAWLAPIATPAFSTWGGAVALIGLWILFTLPTSGFTTPAASPPHIALVSLLWLAKLTLLGTLSGSRDLALLFAPLLGRWSLVVLAIGARSAAQPGRKFNPAIAFREFGWTSVFTGAVLSGGADFLGILIFVGAATLVLGLRLLSHRLVGGVSWNSLGLCLHLVETALLAGVACL